MPPRVELLSDRHDRAGFSCGISSLDHYIRQQAGQDTRRDLAVCYILWEDGSEPATAPRSAAIIGYYTLSMTSIRPTALPEAAAKRLGRYSAYPALLLGRLAVDRRFRGQGHGEYLLLDAMRRAVQLSTQAGAIALVVDAIDDGAVRFYERFEFLRFDDHPLSLYLPIASCRKAIEAVLTLDEMNQTTT